ncbi:Ulp1 protease family protein [Colletotrichum truncatum]|uniref:Ulp1 protease family protein n=1 Tax=Colletotrichum truncatum TaxID=5467 RepID=A0ACC3YDF7_COLTU
MTLRPDLKLLAQAAPRLAPGQWLNNVVINTVISRLVSPTTAVINSYTIQARASARRDSYLRRTVTAAQQVLIPINKSGNHWVLYAFNRADMTLTKYDSLRRQDASSTADDPTSKDVSRMLSVAFGLQDHKSVGARIDQTLLDMPHNIQRETCWATLQTQVRHAKRGILAFLISSFHNAHEACLNAAVKAETLHREQAAKDQREMAEYYEDLRRLAQRPIPRLLGQSPYTDGERAIAVSIAGMVKAASQLIDEKRPAWDEDMDGLGSLSLHKNEYISSLFRMSVVHILLLHKTVSRFHEL